MTEPKADIVRAIEIMLSMRPDSLKSLEKAKATELVDMMKRLTEMSDQFNLK